MQTKKTILLLNILFLLIGIGLSGIVVSNNPSQIEEGVSTSLNASCFYKEDGWIETNGQNYLYLKAENHYELGLKQAQYLAYEILFAKGLIETVIAGYGINYEDLITLCYYYNLYIPEIYQQEMQGMADALGLSYDDILIQNCWFDLLYGQLIPQFSGYPQPPLEMEMGCTGIGINYRMLDLIGQNMDFTEMFKDALYFIRYKVSGYEEVFCVGGGSLKLSIGKNQKVLSTTNLIQTIVLGEIGIPIAIRSRIALETCTNQDDFLSTLTSSITSSWNHIISNTIFSHQHFSSPIGIETIPNIFFTEEAEDYVVRTNTYLTEAIRPYLISQTYSMERQAKAEELVEAELSEGHLSLNDIGQILSFYDGTDASITRYASSPTETATLAFFFSNGVVSYFGEGNPRDDSWGIILL